MKKRISTIFAFCGFFVLLFSLGVSTVKPVLPCSIYGKVLRLHVIANSDSEEDQNMKYLVRDALLDVTGELFRDCNDVDAALKIAQKNISLFESLAERTLVQNGSTGEVRIVIGKEKYPRKTYGGFTFPKGEYLSLRVLVGSGQGKNWWCVLFPPLCNAGVENGEEVLLSHGMDKDEIENLKTNNERYSVNIFGCRIKLKITELFI